MSTAIITGASRGFGRAVAAALVDHGWDVVVDGRDPRALALAADELGPHAHPVPGDVTDAAHRRALVAAADAIGDLELLVNNAGALGPSPLPTLATHAVDVLEEVLRANVVAPVALTQLALPSLRRRSGAVVNVTSDAAVEAYAGWGGYGASKAALEQASAVLAVEEPAVRVWWLDPGDMRTQMHQDAFPGEDISDRPPPEAAAPAVLRLVTSRPPSGRVRAADLLEVAR